MVFDTHVHTYISADSLTVPQDAVERARALGIGVCFTEHIDYELPEGVNFYAVDVARYLDEYDGHRGDNTLLGLEIGFMSNLIGTNRAAADHDGVDFVLGSVHSVKGMDIVHGFFDRGIPMDECAREYLADMEKMIIENDYFDSLAHLDYFCRYCPDKGFELDYETYKDNYDRIFNMLAEGGKALELNTGRFGNPGAVAYWRGVLSGYAGRGGKYVTLGTDAHSASNIGRGFGEALEMADEAGLKPVYYKNRKMIA